MGTFVTESHIPLACAPEPVRVLPIVGDGETRPETRNESLRVRRLTPSHVSWPHTDTLYGRTSKRWAATSTRTGRSRA